MVFPIKSGTFISFFSSSPSLGISKYGNTSENIFPATGAATPPPWMIFTTLLILLNQS